MCSLSPSTAASASTSASSAIPTVSGSSSSNSTGGAGDAFVATTWYAGWNSDNFPLSNLSWNKYTSVTYAFGLTTPDGNVSLGNQDLLLLPQFVEMAHQNNVSAMLTIGGWTGSRFFSTSVAEENRTTFVNALVNLVQKYNLDGLDFDWEYPDKQGIGCNIVSEKDSANFLSFLQVLRATPELSNLTLSAAVSLTPFAQRSGNNTQPMQDVSEFAKVLDYIAIMNYDVFGSWSSVVGANAPLNDTCAPTTTDQAGSAVSAVKAWTAANFPANQIVLGVAAYGHSFAVPQGAAFAATSDVNAATPPVGTTLLAAFPPFNNASQPFGDKLDRNDTDVDICNVPQTGPSGIFNFWGLIDEGFLNEDGTAADGMGFRFDTCSQTPFVYNATSQVMVAYDDVQSFAAKGQFISEQNLLGFAMWEASGDYNDMLLDSISNAMGIEQVGC
ncbi:glycoside hydrolase superfamily [Abortiporus biennis]|nr:glycoside hydrolase superfamily [Abortiporus biennis]